MGGESGTFDRKRLFSALPSPNKSAGPFDPAPCVVTGSTSRGRRRCGLDGRGQLQLDSRQVLSPSPRNQQGLAHAIKLCLRLGHLEADIADQVGFRAFQDGLVAPERRVAHAQARLDARLFAAGLRAALHLPQP